jgi:hypothetical protein
MPAMFEHGLSATLSQNRRLGSHKWTEMWGKMVGAVHV